MAPSVDTKSDSDVESHITNDIVVIVDPYSSGKYLVQELKDRHIPMIAVQSSLDLADFWLKQLEPDYFLDVIIHSQKTDDETNFTESESEALLNSTVKKIEEVVEKVNSLESHTDSDSDSNNLIHSQGSKKSLKIQAVAPASEPGVLLSERLQNALNTSSYSTNNIDGNGSDTREWRRHKYAMQERLREVGVRAVRQIYAKSYKEASEWQKSGNYGIWPIIVKPAMSGGTDGVHWCWTEDDIKYAFDLECGKMNVNGAFNDRLLAQEFLDGTEYIVDCVSRDNKHVLCGIWEYTRTRNPSGKTSINGSTRIVESNSETAELLRAYMFECLDALHIKYGASHGEVIITQSDGKPCLVEVGARMHGLKGPLMTQQATGLGIHELYADVLVNNGKLHQWLNNTNYRYCLKKGAFEAVFTNFKWKSDGYSEEEKQSADKEAADKVIVNTDSESNPNLSDSDSNNFTYSYKYILQKPLDHDKRISNLKSVTAVFPTIAVGDELKVTVDLAAAPGCFLLVHANEKQCIEDMKQVTRWAESGELYDVKLKKVKVYKDSESKESVDYWEEVVPTVKTQNQMNINRISRLSNTSLTESPSTTNPNISSNLASPPVYNTEISSPIGPGQNYPIYSSLSLLGGINPKEPSYTNLVPLSSPFLLSPQVPEIQEKDLDPNRRISVNLNKSPLNHECQSSDLMLQIEEQAGILGA